MTSRGSERPIAYGDLFALGHACPELDACSPQATHSKVAMYTERLQLWMMSAAERMEGCVLQQSRTDCRRGRRDEAV
jgi:hypothetical protein